MRRGLNGRNGMRGGRDSERNREYAMRIMEALSGIDQELLDRCSADTGKGKQPFWKSAGAWAAVFCLAVGAAGAWGGYELMQNAKSGGYDGGPEQCPEEGAGFLAETAPEVTASGDDVDQAVRQSAENGEGLPEQSQRDTADGIVSEDTDGETISDIEDDSAIPKHSQESAGQAPANGEERKKSCSQEEIRKLERLGDYIPEIIPAGYVFAEAYSESEEERQKVTARWNSGTDFFLLIVEETDEIPRTVDVDQPETYDVHLYDFPYAETVPGEYWEVFSNPVFAREDFTLEAVESRMRVCEENGGAVPEGSFRVLYPEGIVVSFDGRGTAEEIWVMFGSMGRE